MRFPSFPTIIRTFYTHTSATSNTFGSASQRRRALPRFSNLKTFRSMPTIPFLGSLFSTSASKTMEYPVKKSDDEWQAVLTPG